jgi:hypothetical protein
MGKLERIPFVLTQFKARIAVSGPICLPLVSVADFAVTVMSICAMQGTRSATYRMRVKVLQRGGPFPHLFLMLKIDPEQSLTAICCLQSKNYSKHVLLRCCFKLGHIDDEVTYIWTSLVDGLLQLQGRKIGSPCLLLKDFKLPR